MLQCVSVRSLRYGWRRRGDGFLDGIPAHIAMPVIYVPFDRAIGPAEAMARFEARALKAPSEGAVACWPLDEERGDRVRDIVGGPETA